MPSYPLEVRERIIAQWDAGLPAVKIARQFNIHPKTVRRYLDLLHETGSLAGRPRGPKLVKIDHEAAAAIEHLRKADPSATLIQLAERLAKETGVSVTPQAIGYWLRKHGVQYARRSRADKGPPTRTTSRQTRHYSPSGAGPAGYPTSYFRRAYPSDLTDAQWELIAPLIPAEKPGGRPCTIPRRELVNGMLYVLRTGCPWRAMPHDLPHWSTVYDYFRQWRKQGVWPEVVAALMRQARIQSGKKPNPTIAILDSQSASTTEKGGSVA